MSLGSVNLTKAAGRTALAAYKPAAQYSIAPPCTVLYSTRVIAVLAALPCESTLRVVLWLAGLRTCRVRVPCLAPFVPPTRPHVSSRDCSHAAGQARAPGTPAGMRAQPAPRLARPLSFFSRGVQILGGDGFGGGPEGLLDASGDTNLGHLGT